jgi:hypothetical protein
MEPPARHARDEPAQRAGAGPTPLAAPVANAEDEASGNGAGVAAPVTGGTVGRGSSARPTVPPSHCPTGAPRASRPEASVHEGENPKATKAGPACTRPRRVGA